MPKHPQSPPPAGGGPDEDMSDSEMWRTYRAQGRAKRAEIAAADVAHLEALEAKGVLKIVRRGESLLQLTAGSRRADYYPTRGTIMVFGQRQSRKGLRELCRMLHIPGPDGAR